MSFLWEKSGIPFTDRVGAPRVGMKAYFFDASTTSPRTVYSDASLSSPTDQPVLSDADGKFPSVFLQPGNYKLRILKSDSTPFYEQDDITAPIVVEPASSGSTTPDEFLTLTGDLKVRYGTGGLSGYVRCNGRSIGNSGSGADERANPDCEDLFLYLWDADPTLAVSTGRGASAASDWASNKMISLPDMRGRALVGLDGMGNVVSGVISDVKVDNSETADTLGATAGGQDQTLTIAQIPAHNHSGGTGNAGSHDHSIPQSSRVWNFGPGGGAIRVDYNNGTGWDISTGVGQSTGNVGNHSHSIPNEGGGSPHDNIQPSMLVSIYMKL